MNDVEVSVKNITPPDWQKRLVPFARRVLRRMKKRRWLISILLCDDDYIRELNRVYRKVDESTDVLSFRQSSFPRVRRVRSDAIGDIVISLETAERNSTARGESFDDEIKRLVVHGLLHLDGLDHGDASADPMLQLQDRILDAVPRRRVV